MSKNIGIIGSGIVAKTLGEGFLKYGYNLMLGTRDPAKLKEWSAAGGKGAKIGSFNETAVFGEILILAVKGNIALDVIKQLNKANIKNKTIIDTTNPIADVPPENGVIKFFTSLNKSQMEILQEEAPEADFVKSFSCIGSGFMVNPPFKEKPTMFICGNNESAKKEVTEILDKFGFDISDMGRVEAARAIEPLCILWCIPGVLHNSWGHAFRLMKL